MFTNSYQIFLEQFYTKCYEPQTNIPTTYTVKNVCFVCCAATVCCAPQSRACNMCQEQLESMRSSIITLQPTRLRSCIVSEQRNTPCFQHTGGFLFKVFAACGIAAVDNNYTYNLHTYKHISYTPYTFDKLLHNLDFKTTTSHQ